MGHGSLIMVCLLPSPALGQQTDPPSKTEIAKWLQEQHALSHMHPVLPGVEISYTVERHADFSPDKVAQLSGIVSGKPDHPNRFELQRFEQYRRDGPSIEEMIVWSGGPQKWRFSVTYVQPVHSIQYFDVAQKSETIWSLTSQRVMVYDGHHPDPAQAVDTRAGDLQNDLNSLLYGPLRHVPADVAIHENALIIRDDTWSWGGKTRDGKSFALEGSWDKNVHQPVVSMLHVERNDKDRSQLRVQCEGSDTDPIMGMRVYRRITKDFGYPIGRQVLTLNSVTECDDRCVDAVLAVPSLVTPDPLRGPLTVTVIDDFRSAAVPLKSEQNKDATVPPSNNLLLSPTLQWIAGGAMVAFLAVWLRIRTVKSVVSPK